MFIKAFNEIEEVRDSLTIKTEMCNELLKLFTPLDEGEIVEIIYTTTYRLAELLKYNGSAVTKLHVAIVNTSLKDSYLSWKDRQYTGFASMIESVSLPDKIFRVIAEICRIDTKHYSRPDYESVASYLGEITVALEEQAGIRFEELQRTWM